MNFKKKNTNSTNARPELLNQSLPDINGNAERAEPNQNFNLTAVDVGNYNSEFINLSDLKPFYFEDNLLTNEEDFLYRRITPVEQIQIQYSNERLAPNNIRDSMNTTTVAPVQQPLNENRRKVEPHTKNNTVVSKPIQLTTQNTKLKATNKTINK